MKRREFMAAMAGAAVVGPVAGPFARRLPLVVPDKLDEGEWGVAPVGMDRILAEMVRDGDLALEEVAI